MAWANVGVVFVPLILFCPEKPPPEYRPECREDLINMFSCHFNISHTGKSYRDLGHGVGFLDCRNKTKYRKLMVFQLLRIFDILCFQRRKLYDVM